MIRLVTCLALLALASLPARAATIIACQDANGSDFPASPQHPCTNAIQPTPITGYGTLAVVVTSIPVSGVTVGPSSPAFITAGQAIQVISVRNSVGSANTLYVCLFGGTCTAAVGIPLAVGESKSWNLNGAVTPPTVISGGTATAIIEW